MSDLPTGFVLGTPQGAPQSDAPELPPGFVVGTPEKKKFGLEDTWPARMAKSIYSAVTLPGDVMQGNVAINGEDGHTNPEVINRSADLAMLASPMSPAARAGVGWAGVLKKEDAPAPTQEMLASAANAGYNKARNLGVDLPSSGVSDLAETIAQHLQNDKGITADTAKQTFKTLDRLKDAPDDAVVTVPNLDALRQHFGEIAGNFNKPTDQKAAVIAKQHLADYLASLTDEDAIRGPASQVGDLTKEANGNYAASKRAELIANELGKAEQNASAANSGANLGNAERTKLKQVYQNDRKSAGYSDDELAQIDKIIRGTPLANATRTMGNALGGGGGLGAVASASAGGAATAHLGGIGAVAPVIGYGLKKYSDSLGKKQIDLLQEMIRRRSPLGQSMPQTVTGSVSPQNAALARALMLGATPQQ